MADFVAVIRKAVDNLSENTPENRAKVYDKARGAIRRQLEAINPRPSDEVIARQLDKLDAAITEVESEHAEALPVAEEETDRLMAELEALVEHGKPLAPAPGTLPPAAPIAAPVSPAPSPAPAGQPAFGPAQPYNPAPMPSATPVAETQPAPAAPRPAFGPEPMATAAPQQAPHAPRPAPAAPAIDEPVKPPFISGADHDDAFGLNEPRQSQAAPRRAPAKKRKSGGLGWVIALVLLLVLAGAGYAAWSQRDALMALFDTGGQTPATPVATTEPATTPPATPEPAPVETAAAPETPAAPDPDGKFTQRLNPDGTETDEGPAPETTDTGPVEGRSVAELTDKAPVDTGDPATSAQPGDDEATNGGEVAGPVAGTDAPAPATPEASPARPIGVSQKMFLYEERLDQQSPAVTDGSVVWSQIEETDADGRKDAAIRGEITAGNDGFSALITIKRNLDASLPASHIIEIVFALPQGFSGGAIDQVQRINMKQTEQDQGTALIAVPAQITPDFYMVALNDLKEAVDTNLQLLRERSWIDIPVVYANGRRALITLEKGTTGSEVFAKVLDIWARN